VSVTCHAEKVFAVLAISSAGEKEFNTMGTFAFAVPILPGKSEVWRRCLQELQGSRRSEYAGFRQRLGITRELVYLQQMPPREIVIVHLEVDDPEQVISHLATAEFSFDRWFKRQVLEILGLDLSRPLLEASKELIFTWPAS